MSSRVLKHGINRITQGYKTTHKAVDIGRSHVTGEPVIAHSAGRVVFCQTGQKNNQGSTGNASYGNCVKLDHGEGVETLYAHLAAVNVKHGDTVTEGQVLGTMGNTGNSYGIHLHFEVRKGGTRVDPTPYLEADLPLPAQSGAHILYQVYTNRWLPQVTDCHDNNADGYAGINRRVCSALKAKPTVGSVTYRVHLLKENRWLPWVTDDTDYAGNIGQPFDAVQMQLNGADGYQVQYRVSSIGATNWYGWCTGLNDATGDGYAGVFGKAVDCIQMKIVKT